MFKKILVFILTVTLIFIVFGCKKDGETTAQIPLEGTYVRSIEVKERIPYNVVDAVIVSYDEDMLLEESNLIFKGIVIDEEEIAIKEYIDGELNYTYYMDIFTFEIEKIYYSEDPSLEIGDVIRVANYSCSNNWIEGTLKMEKDKEYIVLTNIADDTLTIEFSNYYDYVVTDYWASIISIENGDYFFDEKLTSLINGAKEEIIREDVAFKTTIYVKGEEFEEELASLISQKKGES